MSGDVIRGSICWSLNKVWQAAWGNMMGNVSPRFDKEEKWKKDKRLYSNRQSGKWEYHSCIDKPLKYYFLRVMKFRYHIISTWTMKCESHPSFHWEILFSSSFHGVYAVNHRAVPGRAEEGQVGADRDGCTDAMNREKKPKPAKHTETAIPQMTQHMEYSWKNPSTLLHPPPSRPRLWKTGSETVKARGMENLNIYFCNNSNHVRNSHKTC